MRRIGCLLFLLALFTACATAPAPAPPMTQADLARHIRALAERIDVSGNVVQFEHEGVVIAAVSDPVHDRMRLVTPIAEVVELDAGQLQIMLIANYHTTLDARYSMSEGVVYGTFLHPLSSLTPELLASAIRQVAALSRNFGSSYSSDELIFGMEQERDA